MVEFFATRATKHNLCRGRRLGAPRTVGFCINQTVNHKPRRGASRIARPLKLDKTSRNDTEGYPLHRRGELRSPEQVQNFAQPNGYAQPRPTDYTIYVTLIEILRYAQNDMYLSRPYPKQMHHYHSYKNAHHRIVCMFHVKHPLCNFFVHTSQFSKRALFLPCVVLYFSY